MQHPEPAIYDIERARERVSIAPAPEWAEMHPVDETWKAPGAFQYSLLLSDEQTDVEKHASFVREVLRLETAQAVAENAQWRFNFDPLTEQIILHSLCVRREGSSREHTDLAKFRFLQREASLNAKVITGTVTLLVLLEDVRVGDIIEWSATRVTKAHVCPERHAELVFPPTHLPLRHWRWSVRFAPPRPLRWTAGREKFEPKVRELPTGETEWLWTMDNTTAEMEEPYTPFSTGTTLWVQVSDFESWAEVAEGVLARWQENFESPEIRQLVADIAAQAPTLNERITRALTLVQDDIRYLSVNLELGGQVPSPPGRVLEKRFGDCKDKSFLLAHIFRCLGAPARPVLIHTGIRDGLVKLLPSLQFNHVIVEYELEGVRFWADATIHFQGGDATTRWVPNYGYGLPVGPGVQALEPAPPPRKPARLIINESFGIDEAVGQSRMVLIMRGFGAEADALRAQVLGRSPEAFGEDRANFYARNFFPGARVVGQVQWRDDRAGNEFRVGMHLALPITGAVSTDTSVSTFSYFAHLIRAHLPLFAENRKTAVQLAQERIRLEHTIEMMGAPMGSGSGAMLSVKHDAFRFSAHTENRSNSHVMSFVVEIRREQLRPRELRQYLAEAQKVWAATSVRLYIFRGQKIGVNARKAGVLFPKDRPPVKPLHLPDPHPLPLEPIAALAPRAERPAPELLGVANPPATEPVAEPVRIRRQLAHILPPMPDEAAAERRRQSGRRSSSRRRGFWSRWRAKNFRGTPPLWVILVLVAAAAFGALVLVLMH